MECWSTPLQWLCEVAGYGQVLEHAVVYSDTEHPKDAQRVTCPVSCEEGPPASLLPQATEEIQSELKKSSDS